MNPSRHFARISNVVLTGPAVTANGDVVLRADLISQATKLGWNIQKSVQATTEMLVASRADTVKAREAKERGIIVVTYAEFLAQIGPVPATGTYDGNVDWVPPPKKLFAKALAQAALLPEDTMVEFI
ncbi:BRCT domain-containing protein [Roseococcus pinisoli]|uniref:BRCT domain-containing protein n=1 Tax=Roseococcus pinisoli TaxID=2835040 RepID=A0ABS5QFC1_9PROT|nr:hypothetical protein [Roseococcus pinisoli]MBS7812389.1 hypothetical protein [Roseococcus pinisoli]